MIKGTIYQENMTKINLFALSSTLSKYMNPKNNINKSLTIIGGFDILLSMI